MAEIDEVVEKVSKGLEVARWQLLDKSPFIGEMLLRFSIVPTYDCRIDTAATDGTKIYFDCEFYSKLTPGQREFILAHEVWHNIFLHFIRQKARDTKMWNIATDMEINHMLQNEGMEILPGVCIPPPIVAGKNAEDIYAYLMKMQQKQQQMKMNGGGSGNDQQDDNDGDGDQQDGQGGGSSGGQSKQSKKGQKGGQGGGSGGNNDDGDDDCDTGNNQTKHGNQFDKHIYAGENGGQAKPKQGKWGQKGYDPNFNPSSTKKDSKELEDKIKEMVCSVAQSIERKQGHLPAGIDMIVKEMLKPEINWKEQLSQFVTKVLGGDHSWRRCSRHALARGHYLPGKIDERITLALAIDTSGSTNPDLPKFLGEINGLLNSFGKYEITVIQCDAEIQEVKHYSDAEPMDVLNFKMKGGGGTSFKPVFKWIRESGEEYNCCVFFTDGYGDAPKYPIPGLPTLWVLTSDGCEDFCDWGEKMKFKPQNERL